MFYRWSCWVQLLILRSRMILLIWQINCILHILIVHAYVWHMMSLSHTWYYLMELSFFCLYVGQICTSLPLQLLILKYYADICWCRFHSGPFNFWTMWTNSTHSHEIRVNPCCAQNWRSEICFCYLLPQLHKN